MARQQSPTATFNTLAHFNGQTGAFGQGVARHPFRYFIARGETLAMIETAITDAAAHQANLQALTDEVGASKIEYGRFYFSFSNNGVTREDPVVKVSMREDLFIADPQTPSEFTVNHAADGAAALCEKLARLRDATGTEADELKAALIKEHNASDIVGDKIIFHAARIAGRQIVYTPPARLTANPVFIAADAREIHNPRSFVPDASTPAGLALIRRLAALHEQKNPLERVMKWLGAWDVSTDPHGHPRFKDHPGRPNDKTSGRCEKIGDEWIVAVPVIGAGSYGADGKGGMLSGYQEEIAVPPGAVPLSIADYFARLERAELLSFAGPRAVPAPK